MSSEPALTSRPRGGDRCTPAERVTRSLLGYGMVAGPLYILVSIVEGLTRPGFDFTRHDWSLLALGPFGWIHVTLLILTGLTVIAAAVGLGRELRSQGERRTAAWFLAGFGAGMIGAGIFPADPADGFPLGTPAGPTTTISSHGLLHLVFGGAGFTALVVACILVAVHFRRARSTAWFWFSLITGVVYLAAFIGIASGSPTPETVLSFTAAVVLAFLWLFLLSRHRFYLISSRHDDEVSA